jgi:hypothetical protein
MRACGHPTPAFSLLNPMKRGGGAPVEGHSKGQGRWPENHARMPAMPAAPDPAQIHNYPP